MPVCLQILPNAFKRRSKAKKPEKIKEIIDEGIKLNKRKKVIMYTASFTHPKRKEILEYLLSKES